jgi:hypothetical protein
MVSRIIQVAAKWTLVKVFICNMFSVTVVIIFRVSLDKNTINLLTAYMQEVYQVAPSLQSNAILWKFIKTYKGRYHMTS